MSAMRDIAANTRTSGPTSGSWQFRFFVRFVRPRLEPQEMACPAYIIPSRAKHTATVIFAHGLGDCGESWKFLGEKLGSCGLFSGIKWIFPNAPSRPVTLNFGMKMPSWYDVRSLDETEDDDEENMVKSAAEIQRWVQEEMGMGICSERIVVGGFSQGCVIGLLVRFGGEIWG